MFSAAFVYKANIGLILNAIRGHPDQWESISFDLGHQSNVCGPITFAEGDLEGLST